MPRKPRETQDHPEYAGRECHVLLFTVYRFLLCPIRPERKVPEELAARDRSASPAYLRLMEPTRRPGTGAVARTARRPWR